MRPNVVLILFPWLQIITIVFNMQVKGSMGLVERKGTSAKITKKETSVQKFNPSKWGKKYVAFLKL